MVSLLVGSVALSGLLLAVAPVPPVAPAQAGESARMPGVPFDELARRAGDALEGGRLDEALRFYDAGLELNPLWQDGWWRVALIHFDAERYSQAKDALRRLVRLEPGSGPPWALLGLSEYKLGSYDDALASLSRAVAIGVPEGEPIGREALHHLGLLLVRGGQLAAASQLLSKLALLEPGDPELVTACGLMALRRTSLPSEVPAAEKDLVDSAGRATHAALAFKDKEAREYFQALVTRYPNQRGVHYVYGLYLSRDASDEGLPLFRKEIELFPDHVDAQLELAFAALDRGDPKDALEPARAAVRLAPDRPGAHLALGRALVATGALEPGITQLEDAARRDPDQRDVHLALAQAYARAGRPDGVRRAKEKLLELEARRGAH